MNGNLLDVLTCYIYIYIYCARPIGGGYLRLAIDVILEGTSPEMDGIEDLSGPSIPSSLVDRIYRWNFNDRLRLGLMARVCVCVCQVTRLFIKETAHHAPIMRQSWPIMANHGQSWSRVCFCLCSMFTICFIVFLRCILFFQTPPKRVTYIKVYIHWLWYIHIYIYTL